MKSKIFTFSNVISEPSHTLRIFVLNSRKLYPTPYSHQGSLMIYVFENYGYNFYSIMAFWENATFVFWLCQNSWFWVWKKNFSITIFHEKKLPFSVAPFILHLKHWNRAFEAFFWLQRAIWQKWVFAAKACHKCSFWVL